MNTHADPSIPHDADTPLDAFAHCHTDILEHLSALDELPKLLEPAARARQIAEQSLAFFRKAVFEHHQAEEQELFPSVLASAQMGEERGRVQVMTNRLIEEHRAIERLWKSLERGLQQVAKGQATDLDVAGLRALVGHYHGHARYEERSFLPLCEEILGRNGNHMAALGLSLHMRHLPPVVAYV